MRVLIVGFYTKTYMPYVEKYEAALREHQAEYLLTCFDRDATAPPDKQGNIYTFHHVMGTNKFKKILPYFQYIRFVRKQLRSGKFDRVIVLTTIPAVLLSDILCGRFRERYIFDFRDYSYEKIGVYRSIVNRIIDCSYTTFISSQGFMHFLAPNGKINLIHNISNEDAAGNTAVDLSRQSVIRIGFIGYVRYFDVNSRLIGALKNHPKYEMSYVGRMYDDCDLIGYCKDNGVSNATFQGKYSNEDKPALYRGVSIINSMYSLHSAEVANAIPNRLYDAALFKIPILATKGTYLSEVVEEYDLGCCIDPFEEDILERLEQFVSTFSPERFLAGCRRFLDAVRRDEENFTRKMAGFIARG